MDAPRKVCGSLTAPVIRLLWLAVPVPVANWWPDAFG